MIISNQKSSFRKDPRTKCFRNAFRFVGKMTCKQVGVTTFLVVGLLLVVAWNVKSRVEVSHSVGIKNSGYGYGNGQEASLTGDDSSNLDMPRKMLGLLDETHLSDPELTYRIKELIRIKTSVQKELHALEAQRTEMQKQVSLSVD